MIALKVLDDEKFRTIMIHRFPLQKIGISIFIPGNESISSFKYHYRRSYYYRCNNHFRHGCY